jgi:hypothetical protein
LWVGLVIERDITGQPEQEQVKRDGDQQDKR